MYGCGTVNRLLRTNQLLLSAAILFGGSTLTKVLHFLNCLRVACITDRTFYLHQRQYLEPSVQSVWNHKQQQLLSACELPLIIGGDGRADSPGHSAKYGSYGIIDLRTNKVLHGTGILQIQIPLQISIT